MNETAFDLKNLKTVVEQIAEMRQLPQETLWHAIDSAFAAAYKREHAKHGHIIRARFNADTGEINFSRAKIVLDSKDVLPEGESTIDEDDKRVVFNSERHIMLDDARRVQQGVVAGEEILFPLEAKTEFSRIAAQAARQAITQNLHEAERKVVINEFEGKEGTLMTGSVQRIERGNLFVDLGRTVAILPFSEQIRGERFSQGERLRTLVLSVDTSRRHGGFIRLSRASAAFVVKLFELEVPEMAQGIISVKKVVREPGSRTKLAVETNDASIDAVEALVGPRGVRVLTVRSELNNEQIDIIEWSENAQEFVEEALSPATILNISYDADKKTAEVKVSDEQIALAIGRGGQNMRLAAELAECDITIVTIENETVAIAKRDGTIEIVRPLERKSDGDEEKKIHEKGAEKPKEGEGVVSEEKKDVVSETEEKDVLKEGEERDTSEDEKKTDAKTSA